MNPIWYISQVGFIVAGAMVALIFEAKSIAALLSRFNGQSPL